MGRDLFVGYDGDGNKVSLSAEERSTHVHIIGASGVGKSKAMEHMIREDILASRGVCLIDPHGRLYDSIVRWLSSGSHLTRIKRKFIFFNPARDEWTVGFNPLKKTSKDISHQRDAIVKAIVKVWGANNTDESPTLERSLSNVINTILENEASLLESGYLVNYHEKEKRKYLIKNIKDPYLRGEWARYEGMSRHEWEKEFLSCGNRLRRFVSTERVRRIFGQLENVLDIRRIMDDGYILLVNLSKGERLSEESARMLGTLLVNDIFLNATERDERTGERSPFYLYIDEFGLFVNDDIRRILDEGRKFGLHLTLAHQHLGQIEEDPNIYKAVMQDARTKLIFGGMVPEDAEKLATYTQMGYLDTNAIKREIRVTKERKIKTREQHFTRGATEGEGAGEMWSESSGSSLGRGEGQSIRPGPDDDVIIDASSKMAGSFDSSTIGGYRTKSESKSLSVSDVPFYDVEEYEEVSQIHEKSLEEQLYEVMSVMVNQPSRQCILKVLNRRPIELEIPFVEDGYARDERVKRYEDGYLRESEFARSVEEADEGIRTNERRINEGLENWKKELEGPKETEDFYEQEADLEEPEEPKEPEDFYE